MKLGFIGCGNMGRAMLKCFLKGNSSYPEGVFICDSDKNAIRKVEELMKEFVTGYKIEFIESITELCEVSDMILLCVKPNMIKDVLSEAGDALRDKAVISIAAGVTVQKLREYGPCRILRIMPNTPAMVGAGALALCTDTDFTKEEKSVTEKLMSMVGKVIWVAERYMDAITGLSGSGPAYVAMFIEALADGGVKNGLGRADSLMLAAQTVYGTAKMILEEDLHPAKLKDMVCSPGGTTIEGVSVLEKNAFRNAAIEAVTAATVKAGELA